MDHAETKKAHNDHNVYILGAGFAADAGLPLIYDFMERMRDAAAWLAEQGGRDTEVNAIEEVLVFRHRAAGAAYRTPLDVENVEELFTSGVGARRGKTGSEHERRDCRNNRLRTRAEIRSGRGSHPPIDLSAPRRAIRAAADCGDFCGESPQISVSLSSNRGPVPKGTALLRDRRLMHTERYQVISAKRAIPLLTCKRSQVQVLVRPPNFPPELSVSFHIHYWPGRLVCHFCVRTRRSLRLPQESLPLGPSELCMKPAARMAIKAGGSRKHRDLAGLMAKGEVKAWILSRQSQATTNGPRRQSQATTNGPRRWREGLPITDPVCE